MTRAVLGIDAAWTAKNPSGVALAAEESDGWRLVAVAPSYERFAQMAEATDGHADQPDSPLPSASSLLRASRALCGREVDLVAIDMPLSTSPITCRRTSDDLVSRAYGSRKCGTHSPSAQRPGRISDDLREGFERAGYPLRTSSVATPGLVEVYPHPALVELAGAFERLPYKAGNVGKYWPDLSPAERRARLYLEWRALVALLDKRVSGVVAALPELPLSASGAQVKAYEDMLEAVVCAWVAVCVLKGRAKPFGDDESAIWIPIAPI